MADNPIQEFVKRYNLVVDKSKSNEKVWYIRSSVSTVENAELFVKKFSQKTNTKWRLHYGNYNPQKVIFHKHWVCHRSDNKYRCFQKSFSCTAKMDVLVKKVNLSTKRNDTFLLKKPPLPCVIRMHVKHSHKCKENRSFYLKVPDEVKEIFYGYFDNGIGVSQAMRMNEENMKLSEVNHRVTRSSRVAPTKRQVYYIYETWRKQRRVTGVVCEDEDAFATVDVDELLNAIPREDPPDRPPNRSEETRLAKMPTTQKYFNKILSAKQGRFISPKPNPSVVNNNVKTLASIAVTKSQFISQLKEPVTSSSALPKIFLLKGPIQKQHIAVNSPNHLNGSILTVVNSRSVIPLIPTLANTQVSTVLTPQISSVVSLPNVGNSLFFSDKENNSESSSKLDTQSNVSSPDDELSTDSSESISLEKSKPVIPSLLKSEESRNSKSNNEKKSECLEVDSTSNSKFCFSSSTPDSTTSHHKASVSQKVDPCSPKRTDKRYSLNHSPVSKKLTNSSCASNISSQTNSSHEDNSVKSFAESNPVTYLSRKVKSSTTCVTSTSLSTDDCLESNSSPVASTQISITNTVHQSGAQISMNAPSVSKTDVPVMSNRDHQVPQDNCQSSVSDSLPVVKIKEEPPDEIEDSELMETESPCLFPTISSISYLNNEAVAMSHIKVEGSENDETTENHISVLSEDILPSSSITSNTESPCVTSVGDHTSIASSDESSSVNVVEDDEDHKFLMSLLPELRRIPKDLKTRLKIEMQNLLLTTRLSVNKKRRVGEINNIYHDCRILPSFPVLK